MDRWESYLSGRRGFHPIGAAIKGFLRSAGLGSRLAHGRIYGVWERALGVRALRTRIVAARRGTLEVEVDSAALLQELEFDRRNLVLLLQAEVSQPFVERIHFRLGSFERKKEEEDPIQ